MASDSGVVHSVLSGGFLMYFTVHVEGRTLENSCLERVLQYNAMIFLIGQEFGV